MNAIFGFTNIALKQEPKPEVKSCLDKIRNSSEHLLTLINDVLDISRIESGKTEFAPVPMDITSVTDTVLSIVHGFLADRNLAFHTSLPRPETPYVLADAIRMASETPARIMGVYDRKGSIQRGKDADFIVLDHDNYLRGVIAMGEQKLNII